MQHAELFCLPHDLPRRLAGDWCLLFSHPGDFEQFGFERDRWLALVRTAFVEAGVVPAVDAACAEALLDGWIWSLDPRTCLVGEPERAAARHGRFVAIIDPQGRCRSVHGYQPGHVPCSPLDLLGLVRRLRNAPRVPADGRHASLHGSRPRAA